LYRHWTDDDSDCQDTRQEVLISESIGPVEMDDRECRVVSGRWFDPFTGQTFTDPSDLARTVAFTSSKILKWL
jgi:hypothetical protein